MHSLVIPYGLLGSPSGFVSITSASLSIGFAFPWVPLWAARVALRAYFDHLCLPLGWLWIPLGSLMSLRETLADHNGIQGNPQRTNREAEANEIKPQGDPSSPKGNLKGTISDAISVIGGCHSCNCGCRFCDLGVTFVIEGCHSCDPNPRQLSNESDLPAILARHTCHFCKLASHSCGLRCHFCKGITHFGPHAASVWRS